MACLKCGIMTEDGALLCGPCADSSIEDPRFFLSPVLYSVDMVRERLPGALAGVYLLNPMAPSLIAYRSIIPPNSLPTGFWAYFGIAACVAAATLLVGQWVFRRFEWLFPEQA